VHPLVAQPGRPNVRLEEAALAEPAAVAWRGITRGQPRLGERIAVVGDGTVGPGRPGGRTRRGRVVLLCLAGNGVLSRLPIDDVVNNDLAIIHLAPLNTHRFPEATGPRGKILLGVR
jgi:hypothetical protein